MFTSSALCCLDPYQQGLKQIRISLCEYCSVILPVPIVYSPPYPTDMMLIESLPPPRSRFKKVTVYIPIREYFLFGGGCGGGDGPGSAYQSLTTYLHTLQSWVSSPLLGLQITHPSYLYTYIALYTHPHLL